MHTKHILLICDDKLDLLPFPTRRSSDLGSSVAALAEAVLLMSTPPVPQPTVATRVAVADAPGSSEPNVTVRLLPTPPHTDRKSTRLNSSHLVRSYCVVCLKEKKKYYIIS